jgi:hypothetical protein
MFNAVLVTVAWALDSQPVEPSALALAWLSIQVPAFWGSLWVRVVSAVPAMAWA